MAGFFATLLGGARQQEPTKQPASSSAALADSDAETTPRYTPSGQVDLDTTPAATEPEAAVIDELEAARAELLRDLPQEPDDGSARFDAEQWLDRERMLLYVRAHKLSLEGARAGLRRTLEWRRTYRPHAIEPAAMEVEGATGKQYMNGFDRQGHPVIYMYPHRQNTRDGAEQLRWVVFTMEQAIRRMPRGVSKVVIVIDASQYSMSQAVPLSVAREFLAILEAHYPERLFKALVVSPPRMFVVFYHIVAPFIDPVTKAKIAFVDLDAERAGNARVSKGADGPWVAISALFHPDQLQADVGGQWNFKFRRAPFWKALEAEYAAYAHPSPALDAPP